MAVTPRFEIEEVTGSLRRVSLAGRALPYQAVEWGGELRLKETYYPGNPEASIQLFGPKQKPTSIEGFWKDRFLSTSGVQATGFDGLGDPQNIVAASLIAAFKSLRDSANRLRVQWGEETRLGYLSEFSATYDRTEDVRWSCTFTWESEPRLTPSAVSTQPEADDVTEPFLELEDVGAQTPAAVLPEPAAAARGALARQRVGVGAVFDAIRSFQSSVSSVTESINASRKLSAAANGIRDEANIVGDQLNDKPYNYQTTSDGILTVLGVESWRRTYNKKQNDFASSSLRNASSISLNATPTSIATVVLPSDTTLRSLSLRYYGSSDDWWIIADANNLVESVARAGSVIVIPPKTVRR